MSKTYRKRNIDHRFLPKNKVVNVDKKHQFCVSVDGACTLGFYSDDFGDNVWTAKQKKLAKRIKAITIRNQSKKVINDQLHDTLIG